MPLKLLQSMHLPIYFIAYHLICHYLINFSSPSLGTYRYILFPDTGRWDWNAALTMGAILSATDPVAVVALMKELGVSERLATLIEGESLLNDSTAIVVFQVSPLFCPFQETTHLDIEQPDGWPRKYILSIPQK